MKDVITSATNLVSDYNINYNPGMPLTLDYRPITLSRTYKGSMAKLTPPGTNVYRDKQRKQSDSYVQRDDLNAKHIFNLLSGKPGYHTDYAGLIMCAYFQRSPDDWCNLFNTMNTRLLYNHILHSITGITNVQASKFISCNTEYFPDTTPYIDLCTQDLSPKAHELVLRSIQEF